MNVAGDNTLSPAQRQVIDVLIGWGQPRPVFAADLSQQLRTRLDEALAPALDHVRSTPLKVTKRDLARVHACESHFVAERGRTAPWSPRLVRGTIAHKALELAVTYRGEPAALELVDHAIDSFVADDQPSALGAYLAAASPLELTEVRAQANDVVAKFLEAWPRLRPAWSPRTETVIAAEICGGRIQLRGKVDLALGRAQGLQARVLIVDLKTGGRYPAHLDDLRFYALVQALRVGVPPFRVASYYLDTATFHSEDVTVESLEIAARRVADGVRRLVELDGAVREADISPGPACAYCRLRDDCEGPALLRQRGDDREF